jgi:hypothetical protein
VVFVVTSRRQRGERGDRGERVESVGREFGRELREGGGRKRVFVGWRLGVQG